MKRSQLVAGVRLVLDANTRVNGRTVLSPPQIRELLRDQNRVPSLQKVERALVVLAVTRQAEQAGEGWHITLKGHEVNRESTI